MVSPSSIPEGLQRGAVVFDRDGVLNVDVNYAHRPDQIVWIPGAFEAVKAVNDAGLFAFVATNQAGVARGFYSEAQVQQLHTWMNDQMAAHGARIDAFEYSPYHPQAAVDVYRQATDCRKPGPGMINRLFDRFPVDRARAVMIGDRDSDIAAAQAAGIEGILFNGSNLLDVVLPLIAKLRAKGAFPAV